MDSDRVEKWRHLSKHIAPYPTGRLPLSTPRAHRWGSAPTNSTNPTSPTNLTEVFIDYDNCDKLQVLCSSILQPCKCPSEDATCRGLFKTACLPGRQGGAAECLWSAHMPAFPGGTIGLASSAPQLATIRASVQAWGTYLNWRTLDSARQFAAAARVGGDPAGTLAALESVLTNASAGYQMCGRRPLLVPIATHSQTTRPPSAGALQVSVRLHLGRQCSWPRKRWLRRKSE